jgi:hypothetical protein
MLAPLPRLTGSLRAHFDADQAYLARKAVLQARTLPRSPRAPLPSPPLSVEPSFPAQSLTTHHGDP